MLEETVNLEKLEQISNLFGSFDINIKKLENYFGVSVTNFGGKIKIKGNSSNVKNAVKAVNALMNLLKKGETINEQNLSYVFSLVDSGDDAKFKTLTDANAVILTYGGKPIKAKTLGQKKYLEAIDKNIITIGVGPAGTGKTYLAVACAVKAFREKQISRIILTRPAVEAGEKLGFLPGDLQQKVDPYLRPLYDALFQMLGPELFARCQERGDIEVAPLAYMRGRTLEDSFIILDEVQNTTKEQMKMFLTRLGENSKAIVTGDITQTDLPDGKKSGLKQIISILKNIEGIETVKLTGRDVVRHKLVQEIIKAYEKSEAGEKSREKN